MKKSIFCLPVNLPHQARGDLWVESKGGEGATSYFTLPIEKTRNEVKS